MITKPLSSISAWMLSKIAASGSSGILFENSGVTKGDKIALCGRNSSQWAVAFLATLTYGAVAVPILHEFNAEQVHNIVNHSVLIYNSKAF